MPRTFDVVAADREAAMREAARTAARLWCLINPEQADQAGELAEHGEVPEVERIVYLGIAETAMNEVLRGRRSRRPAHRWPEDDFA
jgi:hypothetical protein